MKPQLPIVRSGHRNVRAQFLRRTSSENASSLHARLRLYKQEDAFPLVRGRKRQHQDSRDFRIGQDFAFLLIPENPEIR